MAKKTKDEPRRGGVVSRQTLYQVASSYSKEAIDTLADLMRNAKNENIRMGAAKVLLDKALPDLKSTEITGEDHGPLVIKIVREEFGSTTDDTELSEATGDL